jgi:hypothetical protein
LTFAWKPLLGAKERRFGALQFESMIIELTRKHAVLFTVLLVIQTVGLWVGFNQSPVLADCLPRSIWAYFFLMVPGSAFVTTIIVMELLRVFRKRL